MDRAKFIIINIKNQIFVQKKPKTQNPTCLVRIK